jgi:hypothetical protein
MLSTRIMSVLWPSFLLACVLEMLVFGLVDPGDLFHFDMPVEMTRKTTYALAFLAFWVVTGASSALTLWLAPPAGTPES